MDQIPPAELARLAAEDRGPVVTKISIIFSALALIVVILRFITRIRFTQALGWEDYCIAISMAFSLAMGVCQIEATRWGSARHIMFLSLTQITWSLKYLYIVIQLYCGSLLFTKISICLQYRRIFSVKGTRIPIYIVLAFCVASGIEAWLVTVFGCIPVDAWWNVTKKPTAKCIDENVLYFVNSAINVVSDLAVAILPIKAVWNLQIVRRQKIVLSFILSLGWVVCIISMVRFRTLVDIVRYKDDTWYGAPISYFSALETNLGIICASAPALKPLLVKCFPKFASRRGTHPSSNISSSGLGSKSRNSFIRLKGKNSHSTTDSRHDDVENNAFDLTKLAPVRRGDDHPNRSSSRKVQDSGQPIHTPVRDPSQESESRLVDGGVGVTLALS